MLLWTISGWNFADPAEFTERSEPRLLWQACALARCGATQLWLEKLMHVLECRLDTPELHQLARQRAEFSECAMQRGYPLNYSRSFLSAT